VPDEKEKQMLRDLLDFTVREAKTVLIMRGSRDGFERHTFWNECCGKGPILFLMRSKKHQQLFGGCTMINPWPELNVKMSTLYDHNTCLFSVTKGTLHPLINEGIPNVVGTHEERLF
jgi:hypothetical protein